MGNTNSIQTSSNDRWKKYVITKLQLPQSSEIANTTYIHSETKYIKTKLKVLNVKQIHPVRDD